MSWLAAHDAQLAIEARWFRYAFEHDPLLAMSASGVDPIPHQIEAVYGHLLKKPRVRYLFAHDPGAGKTVMAGLVVKELKMRSRVRRTLIVVPGQLREQWRQEMLEKFDERFEVVDRRSYNAAGSVRAWESDQIITSLDFAKRSDILASLGAARFDLIIVDEAHKMSAYSTGRSTTKTQRYRLGEALSAISDNLLFLTATPHKGDPANFRLLLDLLEPGYFASGEMMANSVRDGDNPLFLRRAKEDMVDFDGNKLFMPRTVLTPDVRLSKPERELYDSMSGYVREQYNLALQASKGHNITFALIILQRRFASSTYALLKSLKRRRDRLQQLMDGAGKVAKIERASGGNAVRYMDRVDELSEEERWDEERKWEVLSVARSREELQVEIDTLDGLINAAAQVMFQKSETKLAQLRETLSALGEEGSGEKVLIFTESRDTLEYLAANIERWGYAVNTIHGSMGSRARKDAEAVFRDRTQVMVATEAAGEGINLQFCHIMINYDLPWNPNRLEQRMGRIHRYGQKHPVRVFNMVYTDTREGHIMQTLFDKLQEIKDALGSDRVFDVISDIIPGKNLSQMLLETTVDSRSSGEIAGELDRAMDPDNERIRDYLRDGLATKYIDLTALRDAQDAVLERRLVPGHAAHLFAAIMGRAGGRVDPGREGLVSVRMPDGMALRAGYRTDVIEAATFDKRVRLSRPGVDLITVGHPLFEQALAWAEGLYGEGSDTAVFTDPYGEVDGYVAFHEAEAVDGTGRAAARLLVATVHDGAGSRNVPPSAILDLVPGGEPRAAPPARDPGREADAAASALAGRVRAVQQERDDHAASSEKYGLESLDALVRGIGDDIAGLLAKKKAGRKVDLAIYNKRKERKRYLKAKSDLRRRIRMERTLAAPRPVPVGIVRVVPAPPDVAWRRALDAALDFERARGVEPRDMHGLGYGFDLVSDGAEQRYILARPVLDGSVRLTPNQWLRAAILADACYLYAVDGQEVRVVRNPASREHEADLAGYAIPVAG